jgi:hypothetical protein
MQISFFMMYNIGLNIGLTILLFVTYRVTHYINNYIFDSFKTYNIFIFT